MLQQKATVKKRLHEERRKHNKRKKNTKATTMHDRKHH
jgi:hypothetical protein